MATQGVEKPGLGLLGRHASLPMTGAWGKHRISKADAGFPRHPRLGVADTLGWTALRHLVPKFAVKVEL